MSRERPRGQCVGAPGMLRLRPLQWFLVVAWVACSQRSTVPRPVPATPVQEIEDFTFTETFRGVPRWTLRGRVLEDFPEQVVVAGVHVDFFGRATDSLVVISTLQADSGMLVRSTRGMRVWGNVVVDNREGTTLRTGWLQWVPQTELISTTDTVLVTRRTGVLRGRGLESDAQLRQVRILAQVHGSVE